MTTPQKSIAVIRRGDLLKAEADRNSRIVIKADNIKIGQLVLHPERKQYLVALSNSERGKVLVQPHNCTINLDFVAETEITAKQQGSKALAIDELKKQGDTYGIKYIGTPYKESGEVSASL